MTNATYTLHMMLLRLARGMLNAWEQWVNVTCADASGSVELPRPTDADLASRSIPARQTVDSATQSSVRANDRPVRSAAIR